MAWSASCVTNLSFTAFVLGKLPHPVEVLKDVAWPVFCCTTSAADIQANVSTAHALKIPGAMKARDGMT